MKTIKKEYINKHGYKVNDKLNENNQLIKKNHLQIRRQNNWLHQWIRPSNWNFTKNPQFKQCELVKTEQKIIKK